MNHQDNPSYERILKLPKTVKTYAPLLGLLFLYLFVLSLWIFPILFFGFLSEILLLIPLSLLLIILPTWKYGFVEYEYVFSGQSFCFSKIYGKRKRKQILDLDLSSAILIGPATDEHLMRASQSSPAEVIYATVDDCGEDIWLILFEIDKKESGAVLFHADERAIRFLRRANPHATVRLPFSNS